MKASGSRYHQPSAVVGAGQLLLQDPLAYPRLLYGNTPSPPSHTHLHVHMHMHKDSPSLPPPHPCSFSLSAETLSRPARDGPESQPRRG